MNPHESLSWAFGNVYDSHQHVIPLVRILVHLPLLLATIHYW